MTWSCDTNNLVVNVSSKQLLKTSCTVDIQMRTIAMSKRPELRVYELQIAEARIAAEQNGATVDASHRTRICSFGEFYCSTVCHKNQRDGGMHWSERFAAHSLSTIG